MSFKNQKLDQIENREYQLSANQEYNNHHFYHLTQPEHIALQQKQSYKTLMGSKRFYKKNNWALDIEQNFLTTDFQSISMQLHYGPFATKINTINLQITHQFCEANRIGCGHFGNVYKMKIDKNRHIAIKAIKFNEGEQITFLQIKNIYSQYFIALMASQLQVGPLLINIFGYDIVFFKNVALFAMQVCQNGLITSKNIDIHNTISSSLDILHSLHIVHRDVKPENILWSNYFQKYVLVDYGLSKIVKQKQYQETYTAFVGTYSYCCHQMQKCLILGKSRPVNLYFNDKFGLKKCNNVFMFSFKLCKGITQKPLPKHPDFFGCIHELINFKYLLFLKDYENCYNSLCSMGKMPKTYFYLCNKIIQQNLLSEQIGKYWVEWQKITKNKLIQNNFITSKTDELFLNYFQESNHIESFLSFIPLSISLEIQLNRIFQWINNQMWLSRIYLILNPHQNTSYQQQHQQPNALFIINKIYDAITNLPTKISLKRTRATLLFFFHKFSHYKKRQLLESLSDVFVLIGDSLSSLKIRNFILTITQNSVEYSIKCILYYILDQQFGQFGTRISIHYLSNILSIGCKIKDSQIEIYELILKITQSFLSLSKQPYSLELLDIIHKFLNQLEQEMQKKRPELKKIIQRIKIRFINIYIQKLKIKVQMKSSSKKIQIYESKLSDLLGDYQKQLNYKCTSLNIINSDLFIRIKKSSFIQFQQTTNISLIKQYVQLYFQMSEGYFNCMQIQFQLLLNKKTKQTKQIASVILKIRQKWVLKQNSLHTWNPQNQILFQICSVKKNIQFLYLQHSQPGQSVSDENFVTGILSALRKKVHSNISYPQRRNRFLYLIQMASLALSKHSPDQNQNQNMQLYQQIFKFIEQQNTQNQNFQYLLRTQFIDLLVFKIRFYPESKYVQGLLLRVFELKKSLMEILSIPNFFQQYVRIKNHKNMFDDNYYLIIKLTLFLINNNKFEHSIIYICQTITYFFNSLSTGQNRIFLSRLQIEQKQILNKFLKNQKGCYFIFRLVQKCKLPEQKTQQYLLKIAKCLSGCDNWVKKQILIRYYEFFIHFNKNKSRKLLICERLQARHNTFIKNKMERTLRRIIKNKNKWMDSVQIALNRKLVIFFT